MGITDMDGERIWVLALEISSWKLKCKINRNNVEHPGGR